MGRYHGDGRSEREVIRQGQRGGRFAIRNEREAIRELKARGHGNHDARRLLDGERVPNGND